MKKIILGLAMIIASTFASKAQGLDGIVVEKFYVATAADAAGSSSAGGGTLPTGSITWRFYVDLAAGWELQSVYGDAIHTLNFSSTTPFYNNEDRGATNANAIPFNNIDDNTVILDSYISVGGTCSNRLGVVKSEDDATGQLVFGAGLLANTDPSIGQPVNVRDGQTGTASTIDAVTVINLSTELGAVLDNVSLAGSSLTTNNGAWSNLNGSEGPTPTNRVLIAQITTTGVLTYAINIQIRNTTTLQVVNYVASNPQGAEVTDPSLSGVLNQPNTAPTVNITAPAGGSTYLVGAPVVIDANASDPDGTVSNVEFLVDGSVVGSDNTAPYSFTWTATLGSHNLTARATDNGGAQTTSSAVNILVGSVIPPTVNITSPATGSTFVLGDVVTINANATDPDGTVSQVEFFVDGTSVGTDNTSPYSVNWAAALGVHSLTAVATDDDNATSTSSAISINVFDSSAAYVISSSNNPCSQTNFCLPVIAIAPVNDVIGYDIVLQYDNSKVAPTGVITIANDLITPSYVSTANSVNAGSGLMYITVFFNANAPLNAEFNGTGELLCVEFARTSGFGANDTADFNVTSLQESYYTGVEPKVVSPGSYSTFQENEFNSRLQFWADGSPIKYDASNPSTYLITNIYGVDSACGNQSVTSVQPDVLGEFIYDYANGPFININKDIPNAISVQPVVNGFDGFLTRRVLINDATFVPSVYQMIAMDVNTDGVVSAGDLSQVLQRAVLTIGEFRQDWNYGNGGVSNGQPSKDWLFIDASTISGNPAYQISTTFPFDDGIGYSKSSVPAPDFCIEVPYNTTSTCNSFGLETYTGILVGDVNGNFATNTTGGPFRLSADKKVVFDLTKAVAVEGGYEIPVVAISNETVNALDFSMNINENKMQYAGVAQKASYLESEVNFNTNDRTLRFSSYSLQNYDINTAVASVRFNSSNEITAEDIMNATAYLNGEEVIAEVIGSRLSTEDVQVSVFPNPTSGVFNVISSENVNIQLMDANGRVVIALDNMNAYQKYEFSTSELAAGVYLLKVFGNEFVSVKKVIVK